VALTNNQKIKAAIAVLASSIIVVGGVFFIRKKNAKKRVKDAAKQIRKVLLVGDSQTAPNWSYGNILANNLGWQVEKIAQSGKQTSWMKQELFRRGLENIDAVIIFGGGNDISSNKRIAAEKNLQDMYLFVREAGKTLIAISPVSKEFSPLHSASQKSENLELSKFVMNNNLPSFKINATTELNSLNYFSSDKIHLNQNGHKALAKIIYQKIYQ
jgi:lysophospholipase L1-like esterase